LRLCSLKRQADKLFYDAEKRNHLLALLDTSCLLVLHTCDIATQSYRWPSCTTVFCIVLGCFSFLPALSDPLQFMDVKLLLNVCGDLHNQGFGHVAGCIISVILWGGATHPLS
jgi:hypothetical protein